MASQAKNRSGPSGRMAKLQAEFVEVDLGEMSFGSELELDLSKVDISEGNVGKLITEIRTLHLFAHSHDPRFTSAGKDEASSDKWKSLSRFVPDLIGLIKKGHIKIAHDSGHLLWHTPNGYEALCQEFDFEPKKIVDELNSWLDDRYGKVLLESVVSPESTENIAKEYAFQCMLLLLLKEADSLYIRPTENLKSEKGMAGFIARTMVMQRDIAVWLGDS